MKVQTALLRQAYKELHAAKPPAYVLTPAELKRRRALIDFEKSQQPKPEPLTAADRLAEEFNSKQGDLFA